MSYFGHAAEGLDVKSSPTDPVSDADREAEEVIRRILAEERPDDGIIGEEGARTAPASGRTWIVDPLDGTVNFLYGMRTWAVSIALEGPDGLAVGVVLNPVDDECFSAVRGDGAAMNGRRIHVTDALRSSARWSRPASPTRPTSGRARRSCLTRLLPRVRDIRRAGAAALDLAYVACGRVDAFYERGLKRWDEAAGRLLVEEAGGVVSDLRGEPHGVLAAATPAASRPSGAGSRSGP